MGLVLNIDVRFVSTMELHKLEACMLYGRRVVYSCLAILFAEQSSLSLNRSIAFVLCMTIQV